MFLPKYYYKNIYEIPFKDFFVAGYRTILFDIDNTLAKYSEDIADKEVKKLILRLKGMGYNIALVSNNNSKRVNKFAESVDILAFPTALKPLTIVIRRAMKKLGARSATTILVGDQIFTDVLGGNLAKITTILVLPLEENGPGFTKIKRKLEECILKKHYKKS